jgi:hypothetical protein
MKAPWCIHLLVERSRSRRFICYSGPPETTMLDDPIALQPLAGVL